MLTEFEKEKIELMREFGLRYDEIAKRLGVTKNQVRYYCKKIGCLLRVDEMPNKRCAYCRKKITADRYVPNKKFCNRSCRKKYVIQSRGYSYEWVWCIVVKIFRGGIIENFVAEFVHNFPGKNQRKKNRSDQL